MSDVHDMSYYGKCMVGGIFACGLTHMAVCPLDIVKCRMQVSLDFFFSQLALCSLNRLRSCSNSNLPIFVFL